MVERTSDTGGLIFVPSFSGIFSPYWREDATASIFGLTLFSKKEHILRALLEGIALRTKDVNMRIKMLHLYDMYLFIHT